MWIPDIDIAAQTLATTSADSEKAPSTNAYNLIPNSSRKHTVYGISVVLDTLISSSRASCLSTLAQFFDIQVPVIAQWSGQNIENYSYK